MNKKQLDVIGLMGILDDNFNRSNADISQILDEFKTPVLEATPRFFSEGNKAIIIVDLKNGQKFEITINEVKS